MDVSVIFATHNRSDIIGRVLEAWRRVAENTKYEFEIICSDDASQDNTVEIIESAVDLPIKIIKNKKGGASKARNAALEIAKGNIIIFTGDDIFPGIDFVNAHYENYIKYGPDVATLGRIEWHEDLKLSQLMYHITNVGCEQFGFIGLPPYQFIDFRHFYTSNISVSRELLNRTDKYFSTDFDKYGFEDIEFGYRLQKEGMKIYYDPDIAAAHYHIYDSVEKFCVRQMNAGEELVVFQQMHDDLEDKCICDTNNCRQSLDKYLSNNDNKSSINGIFIWSLIQLSKNITKLIEIIFAKGKFVKFRKFASVIYAGIFKFYFNYGCVSRLALGKEMSKSRKVDFTYKYMKKGYAQIYWDTGFGYNEMESRKWICWDNNEWKIEKYLPNNIKAIRFSPMKNECCAKIKEIYFTSMGEERKDAVVHWHNSQNGSWENADFRHTNDPQIVITDIPQNSKCITITMQIENMKKRSMISIIKRAAVKLGRRQAVKLNSSKKYNVKFVSGQPRKIQILISGSDEEQRKRIIDEYAGKVKILGDGVEISDILEAKRGYTNYVYEPIEEPLDSSQMLQVAYTLLNSAYDFIIVSKAYENYPNIAANCIGDVLVYSEMLRDNTGKLNLSEGIGRLMSLPSFFVQEKTIDLHNTIPEISLKEDYIFKKRAERSPIFRISKREFRGNELKQERLKPLIFIFPIFFAVGGVERNTIEIMRALKDKYSFCVVTMERHTKARGSLHYQLDGLCDYIFDLREMIEFDHYLDVLFELEEMLKPDAIWLCNNSPWFEMNTTQVREIFQDTPIIAQDVYDTKEGWIEYYNSPGVKTFDRYIAITELIKETFLEKYHIPDEKIDVIYPVVDEDKIKEAINSAKTNQEICKTYGLDIHKEHYSYVARISEQKNPIRYLELANCASKKYGDNIEFIMVGDGPGAEEVTQYIAENNMEKNVKRIPYIANIPEFMKVIDGLIITSYFEGMPIVSIEAMSLSVPVFSTDAGDLKRFLAKTKGGMIMDDLKRDIENFELFRANLNQYKENAKRYSSEILEFFSANTVSKKYIDTFEKAMSIYKK